MGRYIRIRGKGFIQAIKKVYQNVKFDYVNGTETSSKMEMELLWR
jgi:hypothetical protein